MQLVICHTNPKKTLNWLTEVLETIKIKPKRTLEPCFTKLFPQKQAKSGLQLQSGCHELSWMTFMDDFHR